MSGSVLGRRYAGALLDIGVKDAKADTYGEQLAQAAAVLGEPATLKVLLSPLYALDFKHKLLADTIAQLRPAPAVANLLRLLYDKHRLGLLPEVASSYRELVDEQAGRLQATVTSAVDLDGASLGRLRVLLQKKVGKKVELTQQTDPAVIGGLRISVGSKVYDSTIVNHLAKMREGLKHI